MRVYALIALIAISVPCRLSGQGTLADYRRAASLERRFGGLTVGVADAPTWIGSTNRFWYRRSVTGGNEFVVVDAATQQKQPAFDHSAVAAALSAASGERYTAITLPFRTFTFADSAGAAIDIEARDARWRCRLGGACARLDPRRPPTDSQPPFRLSPDGRTKAFIQNYNVAVRPASADTGYTMLSYDGSEGDAYQVGSIRWSPDAKKLVAYRRRPGYRRMVYFVLSSPTDQLQPKLDSMFYRKPGDVLDTYQPVLFDVASRRATAIDNALFPNPYQISSPEWRADNRAFTLEYNQRGHQVYRVIEVNAETGAARAVISEETATFFNYRTIRPDAFDSGKKFRFDVDDGREVIWMSERDGWNHLYLYNGVTGRVKNQITKGKWVVRAVDSVDVTHRQIWFQASGMVPGQDPYFVHSYRINFDGSGLVAYTDADANHAVTWSPDHQYYLDRYSRVDVPTVLELRRTSDRSVVGQIEKGDMSALRAAGWRPPEVFVAKGRDGVTDIWGIIVRPTNFDSTRKWPVIESIYAGPQGSFVPKSWNLVLGMQAMAELGFVVVQMDGMGTSNRSKAFHDVAWKNLGDAGFPDRILWHRAVAAKYPWYDLTRVGITGGSAGGQNATGGVLFHGDFYKVAVSRAGCHDNRMDKIWWNEHWMGWPLGPQYEASSNVVNAHRLTGHLLLAVGEHDTNVDPSSTMQLANALIAADRYFDLYVQPGGGHGVGGQLNRRRDDFFVKWLLGVEPPDWNRGASLTEGEATGGSAEHSPDGLEPPPGFFEHPDEAPPFTWW